jgi:hypothetical protein
MMQQSTAHAALRDLDWQLGRVYFLAFLNPSRGQSDPALPPGWPAPVTVAEPKMELDLFTASAAIGVPPVLLVMSGLRTYPQKMAVGSRSISRSRSSIRGDGVILS